MRRREKGSMTVFFAMTALPILIFMIVLYSTAQYVMAVVRGRQILDLCAFSVQAGYHRSLHQRYGFFAIENVAVANEDMRFFLEQDLSPYTLRESLVTGTACLTEASVYEQQLSDFMQLRFPLTLAEQYTGLLGELKDVENMAETVNVEIRLSQEMETYNRLFSGLVTCLDGIDEYGGSGADCVNGFFNQEWTKDNLRTILREAKGSDGSLEATFQTWSERTDVILEIVKDAEDYMEELIREGRRLEPVLDELFEAAEEEDIKDRIEEIQNGLHKGTPEDLEIQTILKENRKILEKAKDGWQKLIEDPDSSDGREKAEGLLGYRQDVDLEYKWQPITQESGSWLRIWREMQDYVTDLEQYVSSEEKLSEEERKRLPSFRLSSGTFSADGSLVELAMQMGGKLSDLPETLLIKAYGIEYLTGMFMDLSEVVGQTGNEDVYDLKGRQKSAGRFLAETEYVLACRGNDLANCRIVRLEIIGLRMISALYHLATDPEKQSLISSVSSIGGILAPGIGNDLLKGLIMGIWAGAEAFNDYERLLHGGRVPLIKDAADWRTSLENLRNWKPEEQRAETTAKGLLYKDHLKILLLFVPLNTMEKRTMDLIQMNLEKETGKETDLNGMITAFSCTSIFEENGRRISVEGEYSYG